MDQHEVSVYGGLGNQIFCLLQAYRLKLSKNSIVTLNISNYKKNNNINDRLFILNKLSPSLLDEFKIIDSRFAYLKDLFLRILRKFFFKSDLKRIPGDNTISLNYFPKRFIHSGYFQRVSDSSLDKKALKVLIENLSSTILKSEKYNNLAIHIRRGDYLKKKHSNHGLILEGCLLNEAKIFLRKIDFEGITIFTDSADQIDISIFGELHSNIKFDEGGNAIDVFKRMANHKGLIASNSTFSLWAGLIGNIKYFSIPDLWMKEIDSYRLGLKEIRRYSSILD